MATNIVSLYRQLFGKGDPKDASVVEFSEHGRVGGLSTGQGFKHIKEADEKVLIDEASSTVTYIGKARLDASTSSADWQIKRISTSGTITTVSFADNDDNYDNIWDNRSSLSY